MFFQVLVKQQDYFPSTLLYMLSNQNPQFQKYQNLRKKHYNKKEVETMNHLRKKLGNFT